MLLERLVLEIKYAFLKYTCIYIYILLRKLLRTFNLSLYNTLINLKAADFHQFTTLGHSRDANKTNIPEIMI